MDSSTNSYHIYGRKAYETPLTFVDELSLPKGANLKAEALDKVGTADWVELVAIPTAAWIPVIQKEAATKL